jgi:hypothetical protein
MSDPSGYFFKSLFKSIGKFFKNFVLPVVHFALTVVSPLYNFLYTGITTGQWGAAALQFGITVGLMAVSFGIGSAAASLAAKIGKPLAYMAKALAHGVVGGAVSSLQGASFKSGFLSSLAAQGASFGMSQLPIPDIGSFEAGGFNVDIGEMTAAAIVGGTVSEISGGKFANGAATASIQYLYNDALHKGTEFDTDLSKSEREKLTELRVMTHDEADQYIADYPYDHTGIVYNKSNEIIYGMLERNSKIYLAVPPGHAVLGVDTVFVPSAYEQNNQNWIHLKVVGGAEISYDHTPRYRMQRRVQEQFYMNSH